jgi:hypothetical protein
MAPACGTRWRGMKPEWIVPGDTFTGQTAYVHWWNAVDKQVLMGLGRDFRSQQDHSATGPRSGGLTSGAPAQVKDPKQAQTFSRANFDTQIPVPSGAANPQFDHTTRWDSSQITGKLPTGIPRDTVLVGIVDTAIALGHRRFRHSDGTSRFVSAWQQSTSFDAQSTRPDQLPLPFGRELYATDIDRLLHQHSSGGIRAGQLDEEAFNRAAGLVEPHKPDGQRDLDYAAAHGTHVLDLATGFDPWEVDDATLRSHRIIAVNLPPQSAHGTAGHFLTYWAIYAIERIIFVADALWLANEGTAPGDDGRIGYPLVINFSFGQQAGAKDGTSEFETAISTLLAERNAAIAPKGEAPTLAPTRIVMPVGNSNTYRCNARLFMGAAADRVAPTVRLPWRVLPADQTSNFCEIWTFPKSEAGKLPDAGYFTISVTPPGWNDKITVPPLKAGEFANLQDDKGGLLARIYRRRDPALLSFVVCLPPTAVLNGAVKEAPAGLWHIDIDYSDETILNVEFQIQSDQSGVTHSNTGLLSYFETDKADVYREDGRLRDSFDHATGQPEDDWGDYGPIQIKGTQNALATSDTQDRIVVGGYRVSDGRPAFYSSTHAGNERHAGAGSDIIEASYPSEDDSGLYGLLAAGAKDGSVQALRGTSMSAGLATREITLMYADWLAGGVGDDVATKSAFRNYASDQRNPAQGGHLPPHWNPVQALKSGAERLGYPADTHTGRAPRR